MRASTLFFMQAAKSKSVSQQFRQSDEFETAASCPDSAAHGHESAHQISAADVASASPSDHAQLSTASPASAKQDRQGAAAFAAVETAQVAAQPMEERAVATRPDQQRTAFPTANLHIEQPGVSQPDVPGTVPVFGCHAVGSDSDLCCQIACTWSVM